MRTIKKELFIGPLGISFGWAGTGTWCVTNEKGYRYTSIVCAQLLTPPEKDITLLQLTAGPLTLAFGVV